MDHVCNPQDCTLCMACANGCPAKAIHLGEDTYGYEAVMIDRTRCTSCSRCQGICAARALAARHQPVEAYAAQAKNTAALARSASGGAFQMLAETLLEGQGVCYGCFAERADDLFHAQHLRVSTREDLPRILNSKYIPSIIGDTFQQVRADLRQGKQVLFSGTPCQVQGLKAYLGGGHDRLFTADIICHGVTSTSIFNDYVRAVEKADHVQIVAYQFRDKEISWGTNFSYRYRGSNGQVKTRHLPREASSYMSHYLRGNIFRENCYRCTLANTSRVSDITLGDFWEIEKTHPALVLTARPRIRLKKGVSCILVNTVRGRELLQKAMPKMILYKVDIPSVIEHNGNLRASSKKGVERESVLETWKTAGYEQIEADYRSRIRKKKRRYLLKNVLKSHLPDWLRVIIFRRFY